MSGTLLCYVPFSLRCIDFKRSQQLRTCDRHPVYEQINSITSFLDASMVYGSDAERAMELRTGSGGLLKEGRSALLPTERNDCEEDEEDGEEPPFMAGERQRETKGVRAMLTTHTYFLHRR